MVGSTHEDRGSGVAGLRAVANSRTNFYGILVEDDNTGKQRTVECTAVANDHDNCAVVKGWDELVEQDDEWE